MGLLRSLVGSEACSELVLRFLLTPYLPRFFAGEVAIGKRIEGLEFLSLLLPMRLAGGRVFRLLGDRLVLRLDGLVKAI